MSGQPWESAPKTCLVFIGVHKSELESIILQLSESADPHTKVSSESGICKELARTFALKVATDGRFKVRLFICAIEMAFFPLYCYGSCW